MKSSEEDIKKFDALEKANQLMPSDEELASIQKIDAFMSDMQDVALSPNFTVSVINSALIEKRKKSRVWFFSVLIGSAIAIVSIIWLSVSLNPVGESMEYLPQMMNQISVLMDFFSNPKVKQLLIISEAILLLIIVDKIISKFRNVRFTAH